MNSPHFPLPHKKKTTSFPQPLILLYLRKVGQGTKCVFNLQLFFWILSSPHPDESVIYKPNNRLPNRGTGRVIGSGYFKKSNKKILKKQCCNLKEGADLTFLVQRYEESSINSLLWRFLETFTAKLVFLIILSL